MNRIKTDRLKGTIPVLFLIILFSSLTSCNSEAGMDSLSTHRFDEKTQSAEISCTSCHTSGKALDPLETAGSGSEGKHIKHVAVTGDACITCHYGYTETVYHWDGHLDTGSSTIELVAFDSLNPDGIWTVGTGSCSATACHGTDTVDWYGIDGVLPNPPKCIACHGFAISTRRQVMGAGGDFVKQSHHVIDYANRNTEIVNQDDCLVCHNQSNHKSGTVRLNEKDTGAVVVYDPASPASLEPFCLSCHDTDGALIELNPLFPFSSGNTLGTMPNRAGTEIKGYWGNSDTVHKDSGLTCFGSGEPTTGCHGNGGQINAHGSASRGLLTKNMTLPVPGSSVYNYADFELCFSCHDSYPSVSKEVVLGYKAGGNYDLWWAPTPYPTSAIQSLFRDRYISSSINYPAYWSGVNQSYNDTILGDAYNPLHNYHMSPTDGWMQNVWAYRGDPVETGRASCTTCHNVHGTGGSVRSTYDEFGITAYTNGPDRYKKLVPVGNYEDAVLKAYPVNCSVSCHSMLPDTNYWHTPSGE